MMMITNYTLRVLFNELLLTFLNFRVQGIEQNKPIHEIPQRTKRVGNGGENSFVKNILSKFSFHFSVHLLKIANSSFFFHFVEFFFLKEQKRKTKKFFKLDMFDGKVLVSCFWEHKQLLKYLKKDFLYSVSFMT